MTHADRVRAHPEWPAFCRALERSQNASLHALSRAAAAQRVVEIREVLRESLQLTQAQCYDLPHLAQRRPTLGRPPKPKPTVTCPCCRHTFEP